MDLPDVCPFISHHGKTPCIQQQGTQSCLLLIATKKLDAGCACQAKIEKELSAYVSTVLGQMQPVPANFRIGSGIQ